MARVDSSMEGPVAVVTLDNPPVNALSHAVREGLDQALKRARGDPQVKAIVLMGAGRLFSGEPEQIAGDIWAFAAVGVHELIFDCRGQSIAESIESLQWFAADVIPLVDG